MPACWAKRADRVFTSIKTASMQSNNSNEVVAKGKEVKCVVWDLDNTFWEGTLLESDEVTLKTGIREIVEELDRRGVLQSIASKNSFIDAMAKLKELGLDHYFLYPEIHWNAKSGSISSIQKNLNIGIDTMFFIDDQIFERDEVLNIHPEVEVADAAIYQQLLSLPRLNPRFITEDAKRRRLMYQEEIQRTEDEKEYEGPQEAFLASLQMKFSIDEAREDDLARAEELTIRTNQLNATGITYNYEELLAIMHSPTHHLLVCELEDKYGSYGKIGLALIELTPTHWHLRLMLMSCRVLSRSVGSVLLGYIMQECKEDNKKLLADFKETERNRLMYATYRFGGFEEKSRTPDGLIRFEHQLETVQGHPSYLEIHAPALKKT